MADDASRTLICLIEGESITFKVKPTGKMDIMDLKKLIKEEGKHGVLSNVDAKDLNLWKVDDVKYDEVREKVAARIYRPAPNSKILGDAFSRISKEWPKPPPDDHLHIFVAKPVPFGIEKRNITPPKSKLDIKSIDKKINKELDLIRELVRSFLKDPELPTWDPPHFATPNNKKFLSDLRIPRYRNGDPSLLFHNLNSCNEDKIWKIFGSGAHQFICNTSGSGKTRCILEGLTKYWGFYLTAIPDVAGVGVRDLHDTLNELRVYVEWESDLAKTDEGMRYAQEEVNSQIASRHFQKLLAARIVVFQLFLELAKEVDGRLQEKHKHIWLLFQLSDWAVPLCGSSHPFLRVINCLRLASDEALNELVVRLDIIRRDILSDSHFVLALDEAQYASGKYPRAFMSSTESSTFRSIICEIVKIVVTLPSYSPIKIVLSGTGLSLAEVSDAMTSGVSKSAAIHLFYELGMFDTWKDLKSFLQRYIPANILESESGKCLQERMREYLQGRYRFSVSFVEHLLKNGLQSPHKLLNEYLKYHITCLPGNTGGDFTSGEDDIKIGMSLVSFNWDKLKSNPLACKEAVQIVQSHVLGGKTPTYGPVTDDLVEYGIARLRLHQGEHKGHIVEPLAFLSIMRWLQNQNYIEANLRSRLGHEAARGSTFEEVGILYLLRALCDGASFSSVFKFRFTPPWAKETAHIVGHLDNVNVDVELLGGAPKNPGLCVVEFADNVDDIVKWIDKDTASAILIPGVLFGPDVILRCRSSPFNETILLMGQFKSYTTGNTDPCNAQTTVAAITSLHPNHWFEYAPSHQRQRLIDAIEKHQVLRFVGGYPLQPDLDSTAPSVKKAIDSLGANVALASFAIDNFRSTYKSRFEATNVLLPMEHALGRKRRASAISTD